MANKNFFHKKRTSKLFLKLLDISKTFKTYKKIIKRTDFFLEI